CTRGPARCSNSGCSYFEYW
nr:immunoglobulin heavy chain junction region [Macaca mulatta]MOW47667.1 immunoglobulin heavy chain junction region [Macaca mulatta]MOW48519.1 immunoglobulin heavy chain junction region [Macaca mulatta]MOW49183.1 immunoglobulin heavy chain junction region [Macaca mulatta]MOW50257.1 immunoglobulin heavy chain junction region [Macaca mulatta]